jgi:hypothetical protein
VEPSRGNSECRQSSIIYEPLSKVYFIEEQTYLCCACPEHKAMCQVASFAASFKRGLCLSERETRSRGKHVGVCLSLCSFQRPVIYCVETFQPLTMVDPILTVLRNSAFAKSATWSKIRNSTNSKLETLETRNPRSKLEVCPCF